MTITTFEKPSKNMTGYNPLAFELSTKTSNKIITAREASNNNNETNSNERKVKQSERTIKAFSLACEAHGDQIYGEGTPYLVHLCGVVGRQKTESEIIVALLHDVFEDTGCLLREIGFITNEELLAIRALTKDPSRKNDPTYYDEYIRNIKANPIARAVKIADLKYNLDSCKEPDGKKKNIPKYETALKFLESQI